MSGRLPEDPAVDEPCFYEIRVEGLLSDRWSDWFDGLAIRNEPDGDTVLSGLIADQAALLGVLGKVQALNLSLVSLTRRPVTKAGGSTTF